ncbi:MAG: 50S ribosomal protein L29 [Candidatus Wolfebacteria bacterium]|nr:50S ribosomal protein L29 [Candidatus Wolfebacteria bacterium]
MDKKDFSELKNKPLQELCRDLAGTRESLGRMRFDMAAGKSKNVKDIKNSKKTIARLLTLITEKSS